MAKGNPDAAADKKLIQAEMAKKGGAKKGGKPFPFQKKK